MIIPTDILSRDDLSPAQKMVIGQVITWHLGWAPVLATNSELAQTLGVSIRSISAALSTLAKKGLLKIAHEDSDRILTPAENSLGGSKNFHPPTQNFPPPLYYITRNTTRNIARNDNTLNSSNIARDTTRNTTRSIIYNNTYNKGEGVAEFSTPLEKTLVDISGRQVDMAEIRAFFRANSFTDSDASDFVNYYGAIGWKLGGKEVVHWKPLAMRWMKRSTPLPKIKFV